MTILIILGIILGIIILFGLYLVSYYNNFIYQTNVVDEAFSGVDVQLKRRYDLIPNLVEVVKQYATHERGIFENVAKFRSISTQASTIEEKAKADAGLTGALKTLFAVAENYPTLKANENFMSLQKDLGLIENDLQLARRYYNGAARNYNIYIGRFPANLIASFFGFFKKPFFEITNNVEREHPGVKF